jgi:hypothetical protein
VEVPRDCRRFFIAQRSASPRPRCSTRAQAVKPKIATIGAGREGGSLGTLFAKDGFQVMFSSRDPEQPLKNRGGCCGFESFRGGRAVGRDEPRGCGAKYRTIERDSGSD